MYGLMDRFGNWVLYGIPTLAQTTEYAEYYKSTVQLVDLNRGEVIDTWTGCEWMGF